MADENPIYTVGWLAENNAQISQPILVLLILNWRPLRSNHFGPTGSELVPMSVQASAHVGLTKMGSK